MADVADEAPSRRVRHAVLAAIESRRYKSNEKKGP